ncbi:glycosyltransferase family 2 protein [Flavobacterium sp. ARAG 55.4]|uniref:glycosyltransferase family 2 protein n=1 Tax=Flavobacterium sp. ARAG 55.4 TaxID=3451357 RepID=UPI003F471F04
MNNNLSPKISIITVSYNSVSTIEDTILSVINQKYTNYEYIIIDGGSNDGTVEIIKKYQDKISFWVSEPDKGIYDAMNKGLEIAKGEFIGILNSDDWYENQTLENVVKYHNRYPNIDIIHGLLKFINKDGIIDSIVGHDSLFLKDGMIEHPTCFIKRSLYIKVGAFSLLYKSAADFEWILRAKNAGAIFLLIPEILTNFRRGGMSDSFLSGLEALKIQKKYGYISNVKYVLRNLIIKALQLKSILS